MTAPRDATPDEIGVASTTDPAAIAPHDEYRIVTTPHGVIVGIGFASSARAVEIAALVRRCLDGQPAALLALPCSRAHLPQGCEAAMVLGLPVVTVLFDAIAGAQDRCITPSARAGLAVAEGAALAIAGPGARLLAPRMAENRVTCALADRGA